MLRMRAHRRSGAWFPLVASLWLGVMSGLGTLASCGGDVSAPEADPEDEVVPRPTPPPAPPDPLVDAQGRLLPSERVLAGLLLPRGLENEQSTDNQHLFDALVPAAKLVQYLGPRLLTGRVEPNGTGASFLGALPLRPSGTAYHMDVTVIERGEYRSSLIIRLIDVPVPGARTPTDEEIREYHERLD